MQKEIFTEKIRHCPSRGREYVAEPAISRKDNKTEICPICGITEVLDAVQENTNRLEEKFEKARRRKGLGVAVDVLAILLASFAAGASAETGNWTFFVPDVAFVVVNLIGYKHLLESGFN